MDKILIADDDRSIAKLIADNLTDEGYEPMLAHSGQETLALLAKHSFALVLLDIMMPDTDGYGVIKQIRSTVKCPIVFVSAKSRTLDTLLGLELGADDYISKPFVVEELVARVKAHIRRDSRGRSSENEIIEFGEFKIYPDSYAVLKNGVNTELTVREFQLFMHLYRHLNMVLTREQLFDAVWGADYSDIGCVTVTIKQLRDKLDPDNSYIKTVWGVGYKLCRGDLL
jgi:DNA-binding response OmpR family regulator